MSSGPATGTASTVILRWLPVVVLAIAIASQALLMQTQHEDSQSGSGFAMFSSVDIAGSRTILVVGEIDGQLVSVEPPPIVDQQIDELRESPTDGRAEQLATALQQLGWTAASGRATADGSADLNNVSVTVRGLVADGRRLQSAELATGISP